MHESPLLDGLPTSISRQNIHLALLEPNYCRIHEMIGAHSSCAAVHPSMQLLTQLSQLLCYAITDRSIVKQFIARGRDTKYK